MWLRGGSQKWRRIFLFDPRLKIMPNMAERWLSEVRRIYLFDPRLRCSEPEEERGSHCP
jgi:hypothetical protein